MVLRKSANRQSGSESGSSILGLKVVGGKLLEDGSMGAFIEKVKKGSTADVEGQLKPGKTIMNEYRNERFREFSKRVSYRWYFVVIYYGAKRNE